jgi:hypothetical protein
MPEQNIVSEGSASLQSAATPWICDDCRKDFYEHMGNRADQLADLVMDYELEWANTLNLDIDKFMDVDFEEHEQIMKSFKDYSVLHEFIVAVGALMTIKEKLCGD